MREIAITQPESDPTRQRLLTESFVRLRQTWLDRGNRERIVEAVAASSLIAAALAMALLFDNGRQVDTGLAIGLLVAFVLAARVEFYMGTAFTIPTELVLVPMLFLLPVGVVPLMVALGLVVSRLPEYMSGKARTEGAVIAIADAWHAVGPALVLYAAGATGPTWADWPVYLAALAAQFGFDFVTQAIRIRLGQGISIRTMLPEFRAIYFVDAMLAPVGLLAAFAAVQSTWALLTVAPLLALIAVFAREREARIENALTLSSAYRGTAHLLGELLSANHEYTGEHSRSVVVLAHQVGVKMGLDEAVLRDIEFGALLHDVGKMSVPNEIINKPGALSDSERTTMREHTLHGEEMLERIGGVLGEVGAIVRSHHERFDGTGYPDRLRGEEIPIAARVICACDSFSAMTTDRPYRSALSHTDAVAELRAHSGTQFDPRVVAALIDIVGGWAPTRPANGGRRFAPVEPSGAVREAKELVAG